MPCSGVQGTVSSNDPSLLFASHLLFLLLKKYACKGSMKKIMTYLGVRAKIKRQMIIIFVF